MTNRGTTQGRPLGLLINPDAARHALGKRTQSWWAQTAQVNPGNLSEVLSGSKGVTADVAARLAAALDAPIGMLFPELVKFSTTIRHFDAPQVDVA